MSTADLELLDAIEEMVVNIADTTPESKLAATIYRAVHWINAPDCRKNHPDWGELR